MEISKTTWWILAATIFVALIIMIVAFFWSRLKAKKIKYEYLDKVTINKESNALLRDNAGELLWDEKEKVFNPLHDEAMEFIINTVVRNHFKFFKTVGTSEYEKITLEKLANSKYQEKEFTFLLCMNITDPITVFQNEFKNLKVGGMMVFANLKKHQKISKDLMHHLKINNIKWDYEKFGNGLFLIVK